MNAVNDCVCPLDDKTQNFSHWVLRTCLTALVREQQERRTGHEEEEPDNR